MSKVFVVDTNKQPLDPVHPGYARRLLTSGNAAVWRRYPFTIILKKSVEKPQVQPLRVKLDPGSKTTGIAIVNDASGEVVFAAELSHRGSAIKKALDERRSVRRSRRQRHTRYRKPRFKNRRNKKKGWLPPSLMSRISNVLTWVKRLEKFCYMTAISTELVKFDLQAMDNPDISGIEYQQGTLYGDEVREYLLEKWDRKCAYCGKSNVPLQIEHIVARANGGTNRISNLCLACKKCNVAKGTKDIRDFLKKKPEALRRILAQAKAAVTDASAVNVTRWTLLERLKALGLPVECGSGGLTKFNRTTRGLPKAHWLDAACVGESTPLPLHVKGFIPLRIQSNGHGCRQVRLVDKFGFPRGKPKQAKVVKGFQTGDMVKAIVPEGLKTTGVHVGRVAVRATDSFDITTKTGKITQGINHSYCATLHRCDGYSYGHGMGSHAIVKERLLPPQGYPQAEVLMIDREMVLNVAKLARLGLSEDDIETFGSQLSAILEHIQILQEADVSNVSPTAHASHLTNITRLDTPQPSYPPAVLLANAPDQEDNCLKVNAVLEGV